MRPELRKKLLAKAEAGYLRTVALTTHGQEFISAKDKRWKKLAKDNFVPFLREYENYLRGLPDEEFAIESARLDSQPAQIRKSLAANIRALPRQKGGRRATFSKVVRLKAIDELALALRNSSFGDAVDVVARRHSMSTDYLRKIWKNRKRLTGSDQI